MGALTLALNLVRHAIADSKISIGLSLFSFSLTNAGRARDWLSRDSVLECLE
jgi:hypothetical protein